ncbi:phosphodiester glycosidase family protein [Cohnella thailandensis]|uniref:Phosphodiester glycosidase family protein n=1 Tax=Cohnella thailandensis TaxID=557557 RepID=A0A841T3G2_9BACL|nr:phosphodiester glycosidase family protein [Cohnella thailandensis]MBB6637396.1 phosphodiester glycosidase family protein [Cohnella thailandensis]MBP1976725.1 exopolysaccharide biosynthesis protein [Cohnella thailandensis]
MPPLTTPSPASDPGPTTTGSPGNGAKPLSRTKTANKRRKRRIGLFVFRTFTLLLLLGALGLAWFFLTPSGTSFRYRMADTLITTQHRHWAAYLVGEEGLKERVAQYAKQFEQMGEERDTHVIDLPGEDEQEEAQAEPVPLTQIEPIDGKGYHGYLLTVSDPTKVRLVVTNTKGKGEKVTSMVKRTGAIAGVNAGGFADPNWKGNGFQPIGLVISQGKVFYRDIGMDQNTQIVGIDKEGKMIAGRYTINELLDLGISEAVSFSPRIIVNGKGLIKNHSQGWGIAPRSVMGQKEDGSILFLTIDGRQPGYSIGADLYDAQEIMLEHGAVIAANLDGGSSTVLVSEGGEIVNKPSSAHGERYLPTAWLVFEDPSAVTVNNIWSGLTSKDIDPAKW